MSHPEISDSRLLDWRQQLHHRLIRLLDLNALGHLDESLMRVEVRRQAEQLCRQEAGSLTAVERERIVSELLHETFGLGPLERLLQDPTVSDILVNGPRDIYVERRGLLERTEAMFRDDRHLLLVIQRIAARVGRRIDETSPMVDARLGDGSRFNAIIPPLALDGPLVSIRRFGAKALTADGLVQAGALTRAMLDYLAAGVRGRLNMIISGGTGSGKTTLLNALSSFIPADQRVATIEDAAELRLQQPHVVRLETRPPNLEGRGQVTTRDLVRNCLRMRPDRIVIGECRGPEALDMLQAMNTGHDGSLTTLHANSPQDALQRLELMVGMSDVGLAPWLIRRQISASIQVIVQAARLPGGQRRVTCISEVISAPDDQITMQTMFEFDEDAGTFRGTSVESCWRKRLARGQHSDRGQQSGVSANRDELSSE